MIKKTFFAVYFTLLTTIAYPQNTSNNVLSLEGRWRVAIDAFNTGTRAKWYEKGLPREEDRRLLEKVFYRGDIGEQPNEMYLPGTDNDGQLGKKLAYTPGLKDGLERLYAYDGILWFEKEITIPEHWRGKSIHLFLERIPGLSKVWLNGIPKGSCQAYATPHVYDILPSATPGTYKLTMMVDNSVKLEAYTHHITTASGAGWNGIIGRIELRAENQVAIKSIQVYPDIRTKKVAVNVWVRNSEKERCNGSISLVVRRKGENRPNAPLQKVECSLVPDSTQLVKAEVSVPDPVALWDEFNPALYELEAGLKVDGKSPDQKTTTFGMRELTQNKQFMLNGQPLFLRGTLDCAQFPLKADPAMDKAAWLQVLGVYQQYGLNHVRFHTWCPPEAAFQAADELGMIFQVEMASPPYPEFLAILDAYGNHPSFALVSLHNERSHNDFTRETIKKGKDYDPRHLYCCTSHPWVSGCTDDFYVSAWGVDRKRTVGIQWTGVDVISVSRFNTHPPETSSDYRDAIQGIDAPMISHEMGQWAVYPDISELPKYNGVLRNFNYERIKEDLWEKGLLSQASDFTRASGMLSLTLYKEEIEATLRTPLYGGFQLLDIHDFQGQGISTVGILNAFWESKGLITPEGFREFCSPAVPLFRMDKRVWTQQETLEGAAELSYFGPAVKKELQPVWRICDDKGKVLMSGKLGKTNLNSRGLLPLGKVQIPLNKLPTPSKLQFVLEIPEIKALNRWDFWLYPDKIDTAAKPDVQVFTEWSDQIEEALSLGKKVLFLQKEENLPGSRVGCFTTIFWNSLMKWHQIPHTMGILCDPAHPVFADFPTDSYANWQWWYLTMNSRVMALDKLPAQVKPLVQVVDNMVTNQKLGYLFECKAGKGKLVVCSMDIWSDLDHRPVAGQFRKSLMQYMHSEKFDPEYGISFNEIHQLFE